jgi:hypothetical protein
MMMEDGSNQYDILKIYDEEREKCNHEESKSSPSTTACAPIEKKDFDAFEEINWSLSLKDWIGNQRGGGE